MFKQYSTKLKAYFSNNSQDAVEIEARRRINEEKMRNAEIKRMIEFEGAVVETMSMMRADPSFNTRDEIEKEEKERKDADLKKELDIRIAKERRDPRFRHTEKVVREFLLGFDNHRLAVNTWQIDLDFLLSQFERNQKIKDYANDIAIKFGYPDGFPTNLTIMENRVCSRVNAT